MIISTHYPKFLVAWLLAIGLVWLSYTFVTNDYMTERPVMVTVYDKLQVNGSKGSVYLSVIYKTDDGTVFDQYVSPSTYATSHVGERYAIHLRPFDIRQTAKQNALYFFGPVITMAFSATYIFWLLIFGWGMLDGAQFRMASEMRPVIRKERAN